MDLTLIWQFHSCLMKQHLFCVLMSFEERSRFGVVYSRYMLLHNQRLREAAPVLVLLVLPFIQRSGTPFLTQRAWTPLRTPCSANSVWKWVQIRALLVKPLTSYCERPHTHAHLPFNNLHSSVGVRSGRYLAIRY